MGFDEGDYCRKKTKLKLSNDWFCMLNIGALSKHYKGDIDLKMPSDI